MIDDLTALTKLDEAIQLLKSAGYTFDQINFSERHVLSTSNDYSKRSVQIQCEKKLPIAETMEIKKVRELPSFSEKGIC